MIVSEVMTTKLVTVTADDTLSHAANLLRQYQFHHLPVVRAASKTVTTKHGTYTSPLILEGLLTSQDIDLAAALSREHTHGGQSRSWQERRVIEVMKQIGALVTPTTSVAAAAQLLVERGIHGMPVVAYASRETEEQSPEQEPEAILVGLLTRSDLLIALARTMGAYEPGMQLDISLPGGDLTPLTKMLQMVADLHIQVRSIIAGPMKGSIPLVAHARLGTMNPTPLLVRLKQAHIAYQFADLQAEGDAYA